MEKQKDESRLTVIDFFCGAGGFSEGFRKAGYDVVMGIDNWGQAVQTHNLNHGLNDAPKNVLDFESVDEINKLPDTDIIIGSPPCVLFSLSNHGGNANKDLGIKLIKAYYRIIAVKKFQKKSKLKAWIMENVPNSQNYVREAYTFADLDLTEWAIAQGINPQDVAIRPKNNGGILSSDDYGACQTRKRFVCGEIIKSGKFPMPDKVNVKNNTLRNLFKNFPKPTSIASDQIIEDPNHANTNVKSADIHDHFYDTGVYEVEWRKAENAKINHPYMGKMSFPENMDKPSRTIMATRSASTREAILYKSDYHRTGDGEYRLPTIREAATIMGFPLDYQFTGNDESAKWRQIGNAVCVQLSYALAKKILVELKQKQLPPKEIKKDLSNVKFLDNPQEKLFNKPPKRNPNALFRMHPVKTGNITVDLINKHGDTVGEWRTIIHAGTGEGYKSVEITADLQNEAEQFLRKEAPSFIDIIKKDQNIIPYSDQFLNEKNKEYGFISNDATHPYNIIKKIANHIHNFIEPIGDPTIDTSGTLFKEIKSSLPLSQIMSIYATSQITVRK